MPSAADGAARPIIADGLGTTSRTRPLETPASPTAICALRAGRTAQGLEQLRAFEDAAPASPLAPFAPHERLTVAMGAGDEVPTSVLIT